MKLLLNANIKFGLFILLNIRLRHDFLVETILKIVLLYIRYSFRQLSPTVHLRQYIIALKCEYLRRFLAC